MTCDNRRVAADARRWEVNQSDVGPLVNIAIPISRGVIQIVADFENLDAIPHAERAVACRNALIGIEDPEAFMEAVFAVQAARASANWVDAVADAINTLNGHLNRAVDARSKVPA